MANSNGPYSFSEAHPRTVNTNQQHGHPAKSTGRTDSIEGRFFNCNQANALHSVPQGDGGQIFNPTPFNLSNTAADIFSTQKDLLLPGDFDIMSHHVAQQWVPPREQEVTSPLLDANIPQQLLVSPNLCQQEWSQQQNLKHIKLEPGDSSIRLEPTQHAQHHLQSPAHSSPTLSDRPEAVIRQQPMPPSRQLGEQLHSTVHKMSDFEFHLQRFSCAEVANDFSAIGRNETQLSLDVSTNSPALSTPSASPSIRTSAFTLIDSHENENSSPKLTTELVGMTLQDTAAYLIAERKAGEGMVDNKISELVVQPARDTEGIAFQESLTIKQPHHEFVIPRIASHLAPITQKQSNAGSAATAGNSTLLSFSHRTLELVSPTLQSHRHGPSRYPSGEPSQTWLYSSMVDGAGIDLLREMSITPFTQGEGPPIPQQQHQQAPLHALRQYNSLQHPQNHHEQPQTPQQYQYGHSPTFTDLGFHNPDGVIGIPAIPPMASSSLAPAAITTVLRDGSRVSLPSRYVGANTPPTPYPTPRWTIMRRASQTQAQQQYQPCSYFEYQPLQYCSQQSTQQYQDSQPDYPTRLQQAQGDPYGIDSGQVYRAYPLRDQPPQHRYPGRSMGTLSPPLQQQHNHSMLAPAPMRQVQIPTFQDPKEPVVISQQDLFFDTDLNDLGTLSDDESCFTLYYPQLSPSFSVESSSTLTGEQRPHLQRRIRARSKAIPVVCTSLLNPDMAHPQPHAAAQEFEARFLMAKQEEKLHQQHDPYGNDIANALSSSPPLLPVSFPSFKDSNLPQWSHNKDAFVDARTFAPIDRPQSAFDTPWGLDKNTITLPPLSTPSSTLCPESPLAADTKAAKNSRPRHVCSFCGNRFTRPFNLRSHVLSHQEKKPFDCASFVGINNGSCDKAFTRRHDLIRHTRAKHPNYRWPPAKGRREKERENIFKKSSSIITQFIDSEKTDVGCEEDERDDDSVGDDATIVA